MKLTNILIILAGQSLFLFGDILARKHLKDEGLHFSTFITPWFFTYFLVRQVATVCQMYILANVELGKTAALYSMAAIITATLAGVFYLNEKLSTQSYIGIALALTTFILLSFSD